MTDDAIISIWNSLSQSGLDQRVVVLAFARAIAAQAGPGDVQPCGRCGHTHALHSLGYGSRCAVESCPCAFFQPAAPASQSVR